ncbi:hypothetical protein [Stenotrophomonas sp. Ste96]|uniref:hypothetical protein n=1 Tax=Stenotrophomonas sp. Ste96 TaxID=2926029 RepID=UPI0021CA30CD|nr:hypothetical protein [Stenotrophomonas sp. Ste96]
MELLNAMGVCWWPGQGCTPRWEAWAVAAAIFAGLGSWLAAGVTYYAVVAPIERRKLVDRAIATAAMEEFAVQLIQLRDDLGTAALTINWIKPTTKPDLASTLVRALSRYTVAVPALEATPETLPLVNSLSRLRNALAKWTQAIATFDLSPDPEFPDEFAEHAIAWLRTTHAAAMKEIRDVASRVKELVPAHAQELTRVTTAGDGFDARAHIDDRDQ